MSVEVWQDQGIALHGLALFGGSMIRCVMEHYTCGSLISARRDRGGCHASSQNLARSSRAW